MSGDENFLARWSRRKRNIAAQSAAEEDSPPSAAEVDKPVPPAASEAPLANPLPPIDSIEPVSDIKSFLAPGVPLELTRAALRRAWTADPAIRDFIGLSENSWDFNAPDGVPGFGSLNLQEVRRLVARVLDEPHVTDATSATAPLADRLVTPAEAASVVPIAEPPKSIAAAQREDGKRKASESGPRRRHGGALPQ